MNYEPNMKETSEDLSKWIANVKGPWSIKGYQNSIKEFPCIAIYDKDGIILTLDWNINYDVEWKKRWIIDFQHPVDIENKNLADLLKSVFDFIDEWYEQHPEPKASIVDYLSHYLKKHFNDDRFGERSFKYTEDGIEISIANGFYNPEVTMNYIFGKNQCTLQNATVNGNGIELAKKVDELVHDAHAEYYK